MFRDDGSFVTAKQSPNDVDVCWELREYEELQSGKVTAPDLAYSQLYPRDLIRARIAAGLTQKDLAKRLGNG